MATISMRVPETQLAEIDERASAVGMTRTAFILHAALDMATLDEERLDEIESRLDRAESALFGG